MDQSASVLDRWHNATGFQKLVPYLLKPFLDQRTTFFIGLVNPMGCLNPGGTV